MARTTRAMAGGPRILVVDDDRAIRTQIRRILVPAGYRVTDTEPSKAAAGWIADCDLLLIDADSSVIDVFKAIQTLRKRSRIPVLALSVRSDEDAIVGALESGADDYVQKPISPRELEARIKNALRRRAQERGEPAPLVLDHLEIDLLHRRVRLRGQDVHLSVKLYEVLRLLAESAGKPLTNEEILLEVWGPKQLNRIPYLRLVIRKLRLRLEEDPSHPRHILTERGVGYRLETVRHSE